jgi:hypothetical protein
MGLSLWTPECEKLIKGFYSTSLVETNLMGIKKDRYN